MKYLFVFLLVGLMSCGNDATGDVNVRTSETTKNDKKIETAKQPNCDEMDEPHYTALTAPLDYTGIAFNCEENKVRNLMTFKDGEANGLVRCWYGHNGQLMYEGNYLNDEEDGLWISWDATGFVMMEEYYKNGELISEKCFDESGNQIKCD